MYDPSFIFIDLYPSVEGRLADVKDRKSAFYSKFPLKNSMDSCGTNFRSFSFHAINYTLIRKKSCTPGKAGGLYCEPLKAAKYLSHLKVAISTDLFVPNACLQLPDSGYTHESHPHHDLLWIHSSLAPKNFVQQNFLPSPLRLLLLLSRSYL